MLRVARRVAPRAVVWLSIRLGGGFSFPETLRRIEEDGEPPGLSPQRLLRMFPELASITVRDVEISGPHGPVPGRIYLPAGPAGAGFVWVHGGGFVSGTLDGAESHWVGLALASRGIAVLALDYRKAVRGVRYPVPLDDVEAGWRWAVAHAAGELRVPPQALHLGGASAGGALVAGLTKKLRDAGAPLPRTLVLAYPMLHADASPYPPDQLAGLRKRSPYPLFSTADLLDLAANYAGGDAMLADPYAFAANGRLDGQPPIFIVTGEFDSLRFSAQAYAAAVTDAGGTVTIEMEPRAPHGALSAPGGDFGHRSLQRIARWLLN